MVYKEVINSVLLVRLHNGKANTLDTNILDHLTTIFNSSAEDKEINGIILTGTSNFFSAGGNLEQILGYKKDEEIVKYFKAFDNLIIQMFSFPKPYIAAVNGHSVGGGMLIQLCSDLAYAVNNVKMKFGFPEIRSGLMLDSVMLDLLEYSTGSICTMYKVLVTEDLFDVNKAIEYRFIDSIHEENQIINESVKKVNSYTGNTFEAFFIYKKMFREMILKSMYEHLKCEDYQLIIKCIKAIQRNK